MAEDGRKSHVLAAHIRARPCHCARAYASIVRLVECRMKTQHERSNRDVMDAAPSAQWSILARNVFETTNVNAMRLSRDTDQLC